MTTRRPCPAAPGLLEPYAAQFDCLFHSLAQRRKKDDHRASASGIAPCRASPILLAHRTIAPLLQHF